jgi:hypothetical protein
MRLPRFRPRALFSFLACLAAAAAAVPAAVLAQSSASRHLTGSVSYVDGEQLTIQTAGRRTGVINALTLAANDVARHNYPYVWGGGHAAAGVADAGQPSGRGRHPAGYDCSGSVAAVLAGAGLWPAGSGVPNDAGVIRQLLAEHLIARGPAAGATGVTLYDHPGIHIFMNIDGRFFGTSDGGGGGNRAGGAGWLNDGAPDAFNHAFRQYHLVPPVLHDSTVYGHSFTFHDPTGQDVFYGFAAGDKVDVTYRTAGAGVLVASAVGYHGAVTVTGTVVSVTPDRSSFVLQTAGGHQITLSTSELPDPVTALQPGDSVQATYTKASGGVFARGVQVTADAPPTPPAAGQIGTTATTGTDGATGAAATGTGSGGGTDGSGSPAGSGGYPYGGGDPYAGYTPPGYR